MIRIFKFGLWSVRNHSRVLQLSDECTKLYKAALAERNAEQFDAYREEHRRKADELIHLLESRPRLT